MQTISVSDIPAGSSFHLGELKMVQADELGFLPGTWIPLDDYTKFCISVIRLSIENLILNKIIQCSWGVITRKFLFIKTPRFVDMATCSKPALENKHFGFLESYFIKQVGNNPQMTMEEHVQGLLDHILPNRRYANPGKTLLTIIITRNEFQYWEYHVQKNWFVERFRAEISGQQKEAMINALNRTCLPILEERKYNRIFSEFSGRLHEYIDSAFYGKVSQSG